MKIFIDTNILVYATFGASPFYEVSKLKLKEIDSPDNQLFVSSQVLREYHKAMTSTNYLSIKESIENVSRFKQKFQILQDSTEILEKWQELVVQYQVKGKNVFDCNIAATLFLNNITHIFTHNIADFQRYHSFIIPLPLV